MFEIRNSEDGSNTLYSSRFNEAYHSIHGAINESQHIFIENGLKKLLQEMKEPKILEMGFGTGLNCFLTFQHALELKIKLSYTTLEYYPVPVSIWKKLNYNSNNNKELFEFIHTAPWDQIAKFESLSLLKLEQMIEHYQTSEKFNLVYFDAFSPEVQPELWTVDIFTKMFDLMESGGYLLTYCAKGIVKRNLKSCGFIIESLPGPVGKREITRAIKP